MAMDFSKVLVRDDVLNVTDSLKYAVKKGGQNVTASEFNALSSSVSSQTFNIQVPSEQTIIDREVLWQSKIKLEVTYDYSGASAAPDPNVKVCEVGKNCALSAFPLHQATSVMTSTINNNSVSMNTQDVLPYVLHMVKRKNMHRYAGMTPTALDTYSAYDINGDLHSNNNALGGFQNAVDNDWAPRGSWVLTKCKSKGAAGDFDINNQTGTSQVVEVEAVLTEPLLLSPFIFGHPYSNNQGIYGIQNMNFVFNMNNGNKVWRSALNNASSVSCKITGFENARMSFMFYSPHPSMLMPSRNVVGYYEMPRYITSVQQVVNPGQSNVKIQSNSLQLNQVPDKLIMGVRKRLADQGPTDPDFWLTIDDINIQFNNQSGILSSASKQQLFKMSSEAGCNQSYLEYSGLANINPLSGNGKSANIVGTSGSVLVLDFAKHIQLTEDFYAPGSLGNFNLQVSLTCTNNTVQNFASGGLELVLITMNSGLFVCERGTSSVYTGILTKQDVLDTSNSASHYSKSDTDRMVGAGWLDKLGSLGSNIFKQAKDFSDTECGKEALKHAKSKLGVGSGLSGAGKKKSITDNRFY